MARLLSTEVAIHSYGLAQKLDRPVQFKSALQGAIQSGLALH